MMVDLAYWDERHDGVRVPVVLDAQDARACIITRRAAQELSSAKKLTARECFGVTRKHMGEVCKIARNKVVHEAIAVRTVVLIDKDDVVAARMATAPAKHALPA
jgi:hypothetical protein